MGKKKLNGKPKKEVRDQNPFEKLVDKKKRQKQKKEKKMAETDKLRDSYLNLNNNGMKVVNEKHLYKKENNQYIKVIFNLEKLI